MNNAVLITSSPQQGPIAVHPVLMDGVLPKASKPCEQVNILNIKQTQVCDIYVCNLRSLSGDHRLEKADDITKNTQWDIAGL